MKPKRLPHKSKQRNSFRPELSKIIDSGHGLVKLAKAVNWDRMDELFGKTYCWRWIKRRAAVEPGIGHLKREHRMDRNRLRGTLGDRINAILSAAGMNFRKLLKWETDFLRRIYFRLLICQKTEAFEVLSI